ncbi:unnamed protein product, partial [Brenthis ino]
MYIGAEREDRGVGVLIAVGAHAAALPARAAAAAGARAPPAAARRRPRRAALAGHLPQDPQIVLHVLCRAPADEIEHTLVPAAAARGRRRLYTILLR